MVEPSETQRTSRKAVCGNAKHGAKRILTSGLLAFALLFQGYVASAHFHNDIDYLAFGNLAAAVSMNAVNASIDHSTKKPNIPIGRDDDCPICQALAIGSVSLLPPPLTLPVPATPVFADFTRWDVERDSLVMATYFARGPPDAISMFEITSRPASAVVG